MVQCYVCLEKCETTSPCDCEMPVHKECLAKMYQQMPRKDCTICRAPIRVEYVHLKPKPLPVIQVQDTSKSGCTYCAAVMYTCMAYLVFGWIGKIFLLTFGIVIDPFPFWTAEHFLCFLGVFVIVICILNLIILNKKPNNL